MKTFIFLLLMKMRYKNKLFIVLFLLSCPFCFTPNTYALDTLFDPEKLEEYPYLKEWTDKTGWKEKACSPAAWGYLSDYVEPNIDNVIVCLNDNPIDKEAKQILREGDNNCFRIALIYSFYIILRTDFKTGETEPWNLSEPLLKGIYSGDQVLPEQNLLSLIEDSLNNGMPSIVWAYGDVSHTWLITEIDSDRKFITFPYKAYDFYNGDFGRFDGLKSHMNFVNLREYDGSVAVNMDEVYGGGGGCFVVSANKF